MVKMNSKSKRAQEEIVGFALIIIVVAVILLAFVGFSIRTQEKESVESYEVESFIQSTLQYTTDCSDNLEVLSVQKVVSKCERNEKCLNEKSSCEVLNSVLSGILNESWPVTKDTPVKGYELKITSGNETIAHFEEGNATSNSKGSAQYLQDWEMVFTAYY